jgi:hypothetical protein
MKYQRFDKCVCSDTFGKHDSNGVCRVKECDCIQFVPVRDRELETVIVTQFSKAG